MLINSDQCWLMLINANRCLSLRTNADQCWSMLLNADHSRSMWIKRSIKSMMTFSSRMKLKIIKLTVIRMDIKHGHTDLTSNFNPISKSRCSKANIKHWWNGINLTSLTTCQTLAACSPLCWPVLLSYSQAMKVLLPKNCYEKSATLTPVKHSSLFFLNDLF